MTRVWTGKITLPSDGTITEEMRIRLKEKRIALGLSMQRAAAVMGLNWATIRKWEQGLTVRCSISSRRQLERFLNGEFDNKFQGEVTDGGHQEAPEVVPTDPNLNPYVIGRQVDSGDLPAFFKQMLAVYQLCEPIPSLRNKFQAEPERLSQAILEELVKVKR